MKRVMVVTNSLTGGGAERSMNIVCNNLLERGWEVALVPINSGENDIVTPVCEVFSLNRKWRGGLFNTLASIIHFKSVVRAWKPEIIILNCDAPELFGALTFSRSQLVVVEHSSQPWLTRPHLGRIVRKLLLLHETYWVAVSSHLTIWGMSQVTFRVIPNPLTPAITLESKKLKVETLNRLVFIGRLSQEKQPRKVLEISKKTGIELLLIGDGALRGSLEKEFAQECPQVLWAGHSRDPWALITPGDLLIVPSDLEGDGLVVLEGLQRNIPILVSDINDFRRFQFPEVNYCKSVDDFVSQIRIYCKKLDELCIPSTLSTQIIAQRTPEAVGDVWEEFLNSLEMRSQ